MYKKLLLLLLLTIVILGCGPTVHFIKVGPDDYPSKREDAEVLVYLPDTRPETEYKVIGMVFVETESDLFFQRGVSNPKVINALKNEAGKRGADAIMDLEISSDIQAMPDHGTSIGIKRLKRAQAKAIVFVGDDQNTD